MAQHSWLYADPAGMKYDIGLYHGEDSGHVMVYCNASIVVVDFSIKEDKQYSFYVGDEFFELGLTREQKWFSYELKINKEVKSPLNILRNQINKKYTAISVALGVMFIAGIFVASYLLYLHN